MSYQTLVECLFRFFFYGDRQVRLADARRPWCDPVVTLRLRSIERRARAIAERVFWYESPS